MCLSFSFPPKSSQEPFVRTLPEGAAPTVVRCCQHAGCRPSIAAWRSAYDRPLRRAGEDPVLAATGVPGALARTPSSPPPGFQALGAPQQPLLGESVPTWEKGTRLSPRRRSGAAHVAAPAYKVRSQPGPVELRHAVHSPVIVLHSPVIGSNRSIGKGGLEACSATHPQHAF